MPPLVRQVVEIPVVHGMNQGVDRRVLQNDQWARLVNVVCDQQGAGHKRPGYGSLPNAIAAGAPAGSAFPPVIQWADVRQRELVIRGQRGGSGGPFGLSLDREWSLSPGLGTWAEVDYVTTCSTEAKQITTTTDGACLPSVAVTSDGCEVWSWLIPQRNSPSALDGPVFLARDTDTGATLRPETDLSASWVQSKSVAVGPVAVLLGMKAPGAFIESLTYTPATDALAVGASSALGRRGVWDACSVDGARYVLVRCGPLAQDITIETRTALGAVLEANTIAAGEDVVKVSVSFAPGIGFKVIYGVDVAGVFAVRATSFADAPGLPATYVALPIALALPALVYVASGVTPDGTTVAVWQESLATGPVHAQQLTDLGVLSGVQLVTANTMLRSKPFAVLGRLYALATPWDFADYDSPNVNSFTLDLLLAPEPQASRGWACEGIFGVLAASRAFTDQIVLNDIPIFPEVPNVGGESWLAPVEKNASAGARGRDAVFSSSAAGVTFDFSGQQSACPLGAEYAGCLARSGAQVGWYDGEQDVELSFCQRPQIVTSTFLEIFPLPGAPGLEGPGTYVYKAVYEWIDAQGNLHQSETSAPFLVVLAPPVVPADRWQITLTLCNLGTTRKGRATQGDERQVQIAIFRTEKDGKIFNRLTAPNRGIVNDTTVDRVTYVDVQSDVGMLASGFGRIYTFGEVLDDRPLPGSRCVTAWGNRVWSASADDGKTIWFSKQIVQGEAPGFSEALTLRVDDAQDSIVAFGQTDDKLFVFTGQRVYYVSGDGPNDTGGGGAFNGPNRIASDGGCVDARSVVSYPGGVMYAAPSGIFEVSRALQVSAKGLPVLDETTGCTYLSTWLDAPNKRIYWLVTGGTAAEYTRPRVLVYDYAFDIWSVFVPYTSTGGPSPADVPDGSLSAQCMWQGHHVWATASAVDQQGFGPTPFLDGAGAWFIGFYESPWLKLSGVAGYQRAYRVTVTGRSFSDHNINVDVLTDYDESIVRQSRAWLSTTLQNAPEVERVSLHLRAQLCSAVKVRLYDTAPPVRPVSAGPIGAFDVASLAVEIGVKGGSPRLPATNRG